MGQIDAAGRMTAFREAAEHLDAAYQSIREVDPGLADQMTADSCEGMDLESAPGPTISFAELMIRLAAVAYPPR